MTDYYHIYKGRKIKFVRESAFEVRSRENISNTFINNVRNDFQKNNIDIKSFSERKFIVCNDSDNVEEYLKQYKEIKTFKKISLLKYDGVHYRENNTENYYEYILELRDLTIEINEVLHKINLYNHSNVTLKDSVDKYIYLIESTTQDLMIPEHYKNLIYFEKNIFTIGSYESDEMKPEYTIQEVEEKPYCKPFEHISVIEAHNYIKYNAEKIYNPKIALLDNGVFYKHYELESAINHNLSKNYVDSADITPTVEDFHGTACAGIIGARRHNDKGFDGIATGCEIIGYKICEGNKSDNFFSSNFNFIKALYDAAFATKCDVISCSFSLGYECTILENLILKITTQGKNKLGIPLVFSAGNNIREIKFPKTIPNVFTIAASNLQDEPHESNYGKNVLVSAPGENVVTTNLPDIYGENNIELDGTQYYNYTYFRGTSAAAPIVAGLIGLMLQVKPKLKLNEIKKLIKAGSKPLHNTTTNNYGSGVVNILETVKILI